MSESKWEIAGALTMMAILLVSTLAFLALPVALLVFIVRHI